MFSLSFKSFLAFFCIFPVLTIPPVPAYGSIRLITEAKIILELQFLKYPVPASSNKEGPDLQELNLFEGSEFFTQKFIISR